MNQWVDWPIDVYVLFPGGRTGRPPPNVSFGRLERPKPGSYSGVAAIGPGSDVDYSQVGWKKILILSYVPFFHTLTSLWGIERDFIQRCLFLFCPSWIHSQPSERVIHDPRQEGPSRYLT